MTVLAITRKRFQDAGLRDIGIESCLLVQGTVSGVDEGKVDNRVVRMHKCIYEGLRRTAWNGFLIWLETKHANCFERITTLLEVTNLNDDLCQTNLEILLAHEDLKPTTLLWDEYLQYLRCDNGDLSAFWMLYVDIVGDILLGLIRASREGNFYLHLSAFWNLIPWCFAHDRVNYARYLPAYFAQTNNLQTDHPEVNERRFHSTVGRRESIRTSSSWSNNWDDRQQWHTDSERHHQVQLETRCCKTILYDSWTPKDLWCSHDSTADCSMSLPQLSLDWLWARYAYLVLPWLCLGGSCLTGIYC